MYHDFHQYNPRGKIPFWACILLVLALCAIAAAGIAAVAGIIWLLTFLFSEKVAEVVFTATFTVLGVSAILYAILNNGD